MSVIAIQNTIARKIVNNIIDCLLYAFGSFPAITGIGLMTDEIKITAVSALAERLCPLKIRIRQVAKIDDVGMAEHGSQLHQILFLKNMAIYALAAFKVETVLRVFIEMPFVPPACTAPMPEPKWKDLLHHRKEEWQLRHLLIGFRRERLPHLL